MGLIMLFNKLQSLEDFKGISVWKDSQQNILKESPQHILDIIARFMTILLNRLNLPQEEIEDFVGRIKEGNMPELFENFERVDVPKMREEIARQQEEIDKQKGVLDKQQEEMDKQREEIDSLRKLLEEEQRKLRQEWSKIEEAKKKAASR